MAGGARKGAGRPSLYSDEMANYICDRLALDDLSLRKLCEIDDKVPDRITILRWLDKHPEFAARYAQACDKRADVVVSEMQDIEEGTISGRFDPKAANVVLGSMRWRAEKLAPKRYGTKIAIGGATDLPPVQTNTQVTLDPSEAYKALLGG